jgi:hypothetical protein
MRQTDIDSIDNKAEILVQGARQTNQRLAAVV